LGADLVLFLVFTVSACFAVLQLKMVRDLLKSQRRWTRRDFMRLLKIVGATYGPLGVAFYVGWRLDGLTGAVLTLLSVVVAGALVLLGLAIRSAWVKPS
jgi:chromate transport protein ChrA